jgi:proteasome lid subunit RPN8/RPN11
MPVALESFECHESDGTPVSVKAGVTWIHETRHELVKRYPERFSDRIGGPPLGAARRSVQERRTAWPATPSSYLTPTAERQSARTRTRALPKLQTGQPRLTVRVWQSAMRTIKDEFLATTCADNRETGGWIFAEATRSWETTVHVQLASTPGRGAERGPNSFSPAGDYAATEAQFARDGAGHLVRVGDWHSHTGTDAEPSEADLNAWQNCFLVANEKRNVSFYLGLIVALESIHSYRMRYNAFCLNFDSFGRVIYEPAMRA